MEKLDLFETLDSFTNKELSTLSRDIFAGNMTTPVLILLAASKAPVSKIKTAIDLTFLSREVENVETNLDKQLIRDDLFVQVVV